MLKNKKIEVILGENPEGLSITEIVERSNFARSTVRTILAKLEGGNKVKIRSIGMAKLYSLRG